MQPSKSWLSSQQTLHSLDVGFCDINYSNHTSDPVSEKGSRDSRRQGQGSGYCKLSSPNHHLQEGLIDEEGKVQLYIGLRLFFLSCVYGKLEDWIIRKYFFKCQIPNCLWFVFPPAAHFSCHQHRFFRLNETIAASEGKERPYDHSLSVAVSVCMLACWW